MAEEKSNQLPIPADEIYRIVGALYINNVMNQKMAEDHFNPILENMQQHIEVLTKENQHLQRELEAYETHSTNQE